MSKYAGELIVNTLSRSSSVRVRVGRYFNAIGLRETNPHVIPEIVNQLSVPGSRTLRLGNLYPKRDYIHARDLASASLQMLSHSGTDPWDVTNMGSGQPFSVSELLSLFQEVLGYDLKVETDPLRLRSSDRPVASANIARIRERYGWSPRTGVRETVSELAGVIRRGQEVAADSLT
jgi:UDP-glucose 4-epimerase